MAGIGLLNEKPLHASLKEWCARAEDRFEVEVDGFVIDIVRGDQLIEIQTGSFTPLKAKLSALVRSHEVRLVYPIPQEKWIVKGVKGRSRAVTRRKSPRRGRLEDLFWELVSLSQLLANPNFSLEVLLIREEEVRRHEKGRSWRRRGWVTEERRLLEVVESRSFTHPTDWLAFVPRELDAFTARDLAEANGIRPLLAQKMAYCLRHAGVISLVGRQKRAHLYAVTTPRATPASDVLLDP